MKDGKLVENEPNKIGNTYDAKKVEGLGILPERFFVVDRTNCPMEGDALRPFAYEELWCESIGAGHLPPMVHLWRHRRAFVLGLRDRKLPCAQEAMEGLRQEGYCAAVRHSGGAAVPLDSGVVNVSLILPLVRGNIGHRRDFERMADLLRESLKDFAPKIKHPIKAGEIPGSYCPGDFDLSIAGRKFCGISQRRKLKALIVQAFVNAEGSGVDRGERVRRFYEAAVCNGADSGYPAVVPERMTSLREWSSAYTAAAVSRSIVHSLQRMGGELVSLEAVAPPDESVWKMIELLRARYNERR